MFVAILALQVDGFDSTCWGMKCTSFVHVRGRLPSSPPIVISSRIGKALGNGSFLHFWSASLSNADYPIVCDDEPNVFQKALSIQELVFHTKVLQNLQYLILYRYDLRLRVG